MEDNVNRLTEIYSDIDVVALSSNDFLGYLENKTATEKADYVMNIYKVFFRFSFPKVSEFINNPCMMVIVMEYLRQT